METKTAEKKVDKQWEDAHFVMADVPLNPVAARKILPLGMRLGSSPMGTLFIADYPKTNFSVPYREAALLVHIRTPFGRGLHCCWMIVDDDSALIYGRELLGFPKKLGTFNFDANETEITADVSRRGKKVLEIRAERGAAHEAPQPVMGKKMFNVGGMGQFFFMNPIWVHRPVEQVKESYEARVEINMEDSEFDPIKDLIAGSPVSGRIAVIDIIRGKYLLPVGMSGPSLFKNSFQIRFT